MPIPGRPLLISLCLPTDAGGGFSHISCGLYNTDRSAAVEVGRELAALEPAVIAGDHDRRRARDVRQRPGHGPPGAVAGPAVDLPLLAVGADNADRRPLVGPVAPIMRRQEARAVTGVRRALDHGLPTILLR